MSGSRSNLSLEPLWYKDAVIYQVHVKSFRDKNGDGVGDFRGLVEKIDYLENLGITAIWIQPFYPSPLRDDGYDIADYTQVHGDFGTLQDFRALLKAAHKRGIRVIIELVLNHTSDQHSWFQQARAGGPGSRYWDYYVWSDAPDKYSEARIIFKDFESSNWSWDPVARAYYWHRFYAHQPDLNYGNPEVRAAMIRVLDFWCDLGVDGFRLDAVPYLFEREGTNCENLPETYAYLRELRAHIDAKYEDRMLLAEANQWPEDAVAYFGDGDICQMAFHFPLMPRMYIALQMEDRFPILDILDQTPAIPEASQWALFLRNHDELTLEMVTDEERDYMYRVYARDARARINLGIRRRLAPLLSNDRKKIELLNILLFSLPGTPIIYYGDEIGMGDNYYLGDRNGVRTPMQWSSDKNAGFSSVNPQRLYLPIIIDPEYHYESLNVENQEHNTVSLLWWMKRLIAVRKSYQTFGRGSLEFAHTSNPSILAFLRKYEDTDILVAVNLSRFSQAAEIDLSMYAGSVPEEIFSSNRFPPIRRSPYLLTFGGNDYYWFILRREQAEYAKTDVSTLPLVRIDAGWRSFPEENVRKRLEREVLPAYVLRCRWFGEKALTIQRLSIDESIPVPLEGDLAYIFILDIQYRQGSQARYMLPVTLAMGGYAEEIEEKSPAAVICRVAIRERDGILFDATYEERFERTLLQIISGRKRVKGERSELTARKSKKFSSFLDSRGLDLPAQVTKAEQSNSSIFFGNVFFMKLYRRLEEGRNPEIELLQFLTDQAGFAHIPHFAGDLELRTPSGRMSMGLLQGFVPSQGDSWTYTLNIVNSFFDLVMTEKPDSRKIGPLLNQPFLNISASRLSQTMQELLGGFFIEMTALMGTRTGELHLALASSVSDLDLRPENFSTLYQRSLYQSMRGQTRRAVQLLSGKLSELPEDLGEQARQIIDGEQKILELQRRILSTKITAKKIRIHGDYHLGQVLFTGKDFVIIDFEGEPARAMSERRLKRSPLRDVAGMIRSFHYAAYTALESYTATGPVDISYLKPWADAWFRAVSGIFLESYLAATEQSGLLPADREHMEILLDALMLEKAVYELMYELNNRPSWIGIPIRGILSIMGVELQEEKQPAQAGEG